MPAHNAVQDYIEPFSEALHPERHIRHKQGKNPANVVKIRHKQIVLIFLQRVITSTFLFFVCIAFVIGVQLSIRLLPNEFLDTHHSAVLVSNMVFKGIIGMDVVLFVANLARNFLVLLKRA